jgi:hypothetical protein
MNTRLPTNVVSQPPTNYSLSIYGGHPRCPYNSMAEPIHYPQYWLGSLSPHAHRATASPSPPLHIIVGGVLASWKASRSEKGSISHFLGKEFIHPPQRGRELACRFMGGPWPSADRVLAAA